MNKKIALLVDSCCDIPQELRELQGVYELPLQILYKNESFLDRISITPEQVYQRLEDEVPSTSLPNGETIATVIDQIHQDGYTHILSISISSALSGTFSFIRMILEEDSRFISHCFDTKSIASGAGLIAVNTKEKIDANIAFEKIIEELPLVQKNTHIYFSIPTLTYLRAGGRIGLVTSLVGSVLNLIPIISCNSDGVYETVKKAHGFQKGLKNMQEFIVKDIGGHKNYSLAFGYGTDIESANKLKKALEKEVQQANKVFFDAIGAALGVHTGPGVISVAVLLNH